MPTFANVFPRTNVCIYAADKIGCGAYPVSL